MTRGSHYRDGMPLNKIIDTYADNGCKYATEFLGEQSHCLDCPFGEECIEDMRPTVRQGYIKGFSDGEAKGLMTGLTLGINLEKYTKKVDNAQ